MDGTLKVGAGATFAGIVQTTGTSGVIEIAEGAKLTDTIKEGSEYGYTNDKTMLTLSARVFGLTHNTLTTLEAGKTYKAYSGKQFVLKSFSVDSAARMDHTCEPSTNRCKVSSLIDEGQMDFTVCNGDDVHRRKRRRRNRQHQRKEIHHR